MAVFAASLSESPVSPPGYRGATLSPGVIMPRPIPSDQAAIAQQSPSAVSRTGASLFTPSISAS